MLDLLGYTPTVIGLPAITARLTVAGMLGGALGFERERRDRPAGLRTTMLVSLAACLFTLITFEISASLTRDDEVVTDPIRVVDSVTAGVAFLAAGTIISQGKRVIGVTTGATMWMAGAIGVASGAGYYLAAALTSAITLLVLTVLRMVEKQTTKEDRAD